MTALLHHDHLNTILKYINWVQSLEWIYTKAAGIFRAAHAYVREIYDTMIDPVLLLVEAVDTLLKVAFVVGVVGLFVGAFGLRRLTKASVA